MKDKTDLETTIKTILARSIKGNTNLQIIKDILTRHPDFSNHIILDKLQNSLLHIAVQNNNIDVVRILVKNHADLNILNKEGASSLEISIDEGYYEIAIFLITSGAEVTASNRTDKNLLHKIINSVYYDTDDYKKLIKILIDHKLDINAQDIAQNTVLHHAVLEENEPAITTLLEHNANPDILGENGKTCLHIAADRGSTKIIEKLREKAANINEKDNKKRTALHYAVKNNSKETVKILLKYEANINEKDENGEIPLHIAVKKNHEEIVEILLAKHQIVDFQEKNNEGKTPLDLLKERFDKISSDTELRHHHYKFNFLSELEKQSENIISEGNEKLKNKKYKKITNKDIEEITSYIKKLFNTAKKSLIDKIKCDIDREHDYKLVCIEQKYLLIKQFFEAKGISFSETNFAKILNKEEEYELTNWEEQVKIQVSFTKISGFQMNIENNIPINSDIINNKKRINSTHLDETSTKRQIKVTDTKQNNNFRPSSTSSISRRNNILNRNL